MKNSQKGFVVPLLIGIVVVLVVGVYIYQNKKVEIPITIDNNTEQLNSTQVVTSSGQTVTSLISRKLFDEKIILARKELGLGFGDNYFLAKQSEGSVTLKMIYDTDTIYEIYSINGDSSYRMNLNDFLIRQKERYDASPAPSDAVKMEEWDLKYRSTGSARVIGKYIDEQTIKISKIITYFQ